VTSQVVEIDDTETRAWLEHYIKRLDLADHALWVTTDRAHFAAWVGRRVNAAIGGAYVFLPRTMVHAILINLPKIDRSHPRSVEIVVAEELIHMRDWIDGDRRRHAKHGYDRIAVRVSEITGASLDEIRNCLLPIKRRDPKYRYVCPGCGMTVMRRRRGTWSCGRCADSFNPRFALRLAGIAERMRNVS
jgi:predicted SprT family Zn-dependent metalloprotease